MIFCDSQIATEIDMANVALSGERHLPIYTSFLKDMVEMIKSNWKLTTRTANPIMWITCGHNKTVAKTYRFVCEPDEASEPKRQRFNDSEADDNTTPEPLEINLASTQQNTL